MAFSWNDFGRGALGAYGYSELMDNLDKRQDAASDTVSDLKQGVNERSSFTPWGVKSGQGSVNMTSGGMSFDLDPYNSMFARMGQQGAMDAYGRAGAATDPMEYYHKLRQAKAATDQNNYTNMRSGLWNSGRTGLRTGMFGGSPEEYAFAKAREDSMAQDWLTAHQVMGQERDLDAKIGDSLLKAAFTPQRELANLMQYGINERQLRDTMQREGMSLWTQLGLGGLTADTTYENIRGKAFGDAITALTPLAGNVAETVGNSNPVKTIIDLIFGKQ